MTIASPVARSCSMPGTGTFGEHHRLGRRIMIPGAVDSHVHMRDPGLTKKEDLETGSISAAFGGVTSFIDMPNTKPPTIDKRTFTEKLLTAWQLPGSVLSLHLL